MPSLRPLALTAVAASLVFGSSVTAVSTKPSGHPRRRAVDSVIVHSLGGPDCRDGRRFYRHVDGDARQWIATFTRLPIVSIHYVIGRDGVVVAGVPESFAATHATGWNQRSIGIELVNDGDGIDPFPPVQVDALVRLVRELRTRHPGIAASRVLRHSDVDRRSFAVDQHGAGCDAYRRKEDPGAAFPWDAFRAAIGTP